VRKLVREKAQLLAKISELELRYNYGTEKTAFLSCFVSSKNSIPFYQDRLCQGKKQGKLSKGTVQAW
jgi:hypothetical protein